MTQVFDPKNIMLNLKFFNYDIIVSCDNRITDIK